MRDTCQEKRNLIWKILSKVLLTPAVQANQFTVIVSSFDNNIREQIVICYSTTPTPGPVLKVKRQDNTEPSIPCL